MNPPTVKLNLDEAAGRRPDAANAAASAGKPTLRVKKSDIKEMKKRHHALSSKKKAAFGAVGALVALILGIVLWFARDSWIPYWQDRFAPADVPAAAEALREPGLDIEGACMHFAIVEPVRHPEAAAGQAAKFDAALEVLEAAAGRRLFRHMSSSRAALLMPECDQDAVRVGISLYGYGSARPDGRFATEPILQWKSRVMQVKSVPAGFPVGYYGAYVTDRPTDIAVVSCGYTDGYLRLLGNTGDVLVRGKRRRVAGRVSMNWLTVDLGPDSGVQAGDEVVLLGEQGGEAVWADELARHCETIAYEILTDISRQIERRYVGQPHETV